MALALPHQFGALRRRIADLAKHPLAVPTTEGQFHNALKSAFEKAGVPLRPAVECQSFIQVRALVAHGSCAAVQQPSSA